ncbi:MAG: hypothetical protein RR263_05265, partial [Oscillospiraceae bacterium]
GDGRVASVQSLQPQSHQAGGKYMQLPHKRSSKSGLFLIELMIMILFFSIASAVCIQLFVKANLISTDSRDLSMAVDKAQIAAEYFKSTDGSQTELIQLLNAQSCSEKIIVAYYDKNWLSCKPDNSTYSLQLKFTQPAPLVAAQITVMRHEQSLYELDIKTYIPPLIADETR